MHQHENLNVWTLDISITTNQHQYHGTQTHDYNKQTLLINEYIHISTMKPMKHNIFMCTCTSFT